MNPMNDLKCDDYPGTIRRIEYRIDAPGVKDSGRTRSKGWTVRVWHKIGSIGYSFGSLDYVFMYWMKTDFSKSKLYIPS